MNHVDSYLHLQYTYIQDTYPWMSSCFCLAVLISSWLLANASLEECNSLFRAFSFSLSTSVIGRLGDALAFALKQNKAEFDHYQPSRSELRFTLVDIVWGYTDSNMQAMACLHTLLNINFRYPEVPYCSIINYRGPLLPPWILPAQQASYTCLSVWWYSVPALPV